jgi:hypothetical protein
MDEKTKAEIPGREGRNKAREMQRHRKNSFPTIITQSAELRGNCR